MTPSPVDPSTAPLPADVLAALQQGQTIEAIKRLRTATGLGLKEAKDAIDRHRAGAVAQPAASIAFNRHRAPGEVPRISGVVWLILIVLLAGLALLAGHLFASPG